MAFSRRQLLTGAALLLSASGLATTDTLAQQSASPVNIDPKGTALRGYDPVAYFTAAKPTPGAATFQSKWDGATYQFASAANKSAFDAEPAKYAPRYGGYCAWAASQGYKYDADPNVWSIVDGRLYVNFNAEVGKKWTADTPNLIKAADTNWPKVQTLPPK